MQLEKVVPEFSLHDPDIIFSGKNQNEAAIL